MSRIDAQRAGARAADLGKAVVENPHVVDTHFRRKRRRDVGCRQDPGVITTHREVEDDEVRLVEFGTVRAVDC